MTNEHHCIQGMSWFYIFEIQVGIVFLRLWQNCMVDETAILKYVMCGHQRVLDIQSLSFIDPAVTLFCMNKCFRADSATL